MDLHSKMTMYLTSTMTSPVTKTAKTSKWQFLKTLIFKILYSKNVSNFFGSLHNFDRSDMI